MWTVNTCIHRRTKKSGKGREFRTQWLYVYLINVIYEVLFLALTLDWRVSSSSIPPILRYKDKYLAKKKLWDLFSFVSERCTQQNGVYFVSSLNSKRNYRRDINWCQKRFEICWIWKWRLDRSVFFSANQVKLFNRWV